MSSEYPTGRESLMAEFLSAFRRLREQAVLLNESVAEHLGMAAADVDSLAILATSGPLTAGRLAELTGLTTGAVTRMIDRLEQAGYVRRTSDPSDRRRVNVEAITEKASAVSKLFAELGEKVGAEMARYTDDELRFLVDFMTRSAEATRTQAADLRASEPTPEDGDHAFSAPLGSVTSGRLAFLSGFSDLRLQADPALDRLFRARFAGATPHIRVRGGTITIRGPRFPLDWLTPRGDVSISASIPWDIDLSRGISKLAVNVRPNVQFNQRGGKGGKDPRGEVILNASIPWDIDVRGGLSKFDGDLRALNLRSIDITGGTTSATFALPAPDGRVPIRVIGGASDLTLSRPKGTGVRLHVRGGISSLRLDGRELSAMGGDVHLESDGGAASVYDVEIVGGASRVRIDQQPAEPAS